MSERTLGSTFGAKVENYTRYAETQNKIAEQLSCLVLQYPERLTGSWLDIGCGTAILSSYLFNLYPTISPNLLDISPKTLEYIRDSSSKICADMDMLPFLPNSFDGVCAASSLQWSQSIEEVFQDISLLIKQKGTLAIALFTENSLVELRAAQAEFKVNHPVVFPSHDEISDFIRKNNFTILESLKLVYSEKYNSGVESLRAINRIGAGFHHGSMFTPSQLKRFIAYFESQFSTGIQNQYSVSFFIATRD